LLAGVDTKGGTTNLNLLASSGHFRPKRRGASIWLFFSLQRSYSLGGKIQ
jgi:hypothetical protein